MPENFTTRTFRETPLLFSGAMVRAILDRGKCQTRRLMKPQPERREGVVYPNGKPGVAWAWAPRKGTAHLAGPTLQRLLDQINGDDTPSPFGRPGDRLWVRESWYFDQRRSAFVYRADQADPKQPPAELLGIKHRWQPSIFMPRQACRIELEITAARVEPVMALTEADAMAEGVYPYPLSAAWTWDGESKHATAVSAYRDLWDRINPKSPWETNPVVHVITFKRLGDDRG